MCNCGCTRRKLNSVVGSASAWTTLGDGASTGAPGYTYTTGVVSRYRTEEFGKVGRIQFFISQATPGALTAPTSIAILPEPLATGGGVGCGIAIAGSSSPNVVFPVTIQDGTLIILCIATILEMSSNDSISVDITFPLD